MSFPLPVVANRLVPAVDDLPRFIHHLGPRYAAQFQAPDLLRFLTYDAATSLNIFLSSVASQRSNRVQAVAAAAAGMTPLLRAIKDGLGIAEDAFVFSVSPRGYTPEDVEGVDASSGYIRNCVGMKTSRDRIEIRGDVFVTNRQCLDFTLWEIGGAAIALRLVELAHVSFVPSCISKECRTVLTSFV